jgi:hypothetical protein
MARVACHLADMRRDFDESVPTAARLECVQVGFRKPIAFVNARSHKRTWSSRGRHSGGRTVGRGRRACGSHAWSSRACVPDAPLSGGRNLITVFVHSSGRSAHHFADLYCSMCACDYGH